MADLKNKSISTIPLMGWCLLPLPCIVAAFWFETVYLLAVPILIFAIFSFKQIKQIDFWFWLAIWVLPLSTELMVTDSLGIDFPFELLLIILSLAVFIAIRLYPQQFIYFTQNTLAFVVGIHLLWILITIIFSTNYWLSTKYFLAKCWYVLPLITLPSFIFQQKNAFKKLVLFLSVPMLFVALQSMVRHAFFNFSFDGIKYTLSPFFRNHVNYSAFLSFVVVVLFFARKHSNGKYKVLTSLGFLIGSVALFFAYSRGAWLAMITAAFFYYIIQKNWVNHALVIATVVLLALGFYLLKNNQYLKYAPDYTATIYHTELSDHLNATFTGKDVSNAERWYRWVAAKNMIAAKPIFGFGPNNFYDNYKDYTLNIFRTYVSNNPDHSSVHNYFLLVALEQGLPGLIIFLAIVVLAILKANFLYHQLHNQLYKTVAITVGVLLCMIAVLNMMSDLIETDKVGGIFWLCIGTLIFLEQQFSRELSLQT